MVDILYSGQFKKDVKSIKHQGIKENIFSQIRKIELNPEIGKPLKNTLKGERTVKINPYRLIYTKISEDAILLLRFQHRKEVYDQ